MTTKPWLTLYPVAILLSIWFAQNVVAAPQIAQTTECTNCQTQTDASSDQNSTDSTDYTDSDFDNSQDFGQDQSSDTTRESATPGKTKNAPSQMDDNLNSDDNGDED